MDNPIEQIKSKIDLVDFIGSKIELKQAGRNFKACCPFHQEKTPSFIVNPDRQIWHCFGACKEGGDVFKFVMKYESLTFYESLTELAKLTGVTLKKLDFDDQAWKQKETLLKVNTYASRLFHHLLINNKTGEKTLQYLNNRHISDKLISAFSLGYAPASWHTVTDFLLSKNISGESLVEAGISIRNSSGRLFDRFRGRLIFPLIDPRGNIIGFSGRLTDDDTDKKITGEAKYINSPETPLYKKRETLFGINMTKDNIIKSGTVIVVEGEFDFLSCFHYGIDNVVAIKGSALTTEQLILLKRYCKKILLGLDSDFAGSETTRRAITDAINYDFELHIIDYDFAKDPDEALNTDPIKFKQAVKKPIPVYDYILKIAEKKSGTDTAYGKKELADFVIPYLVDIKNPIIKSHYQKKLAELIDSSENTVESLVKRFYLAKKKKETNRAMFKPKEPVDRYLLLQKYILNIIFQSSQPKTVLKKCREILHNSDFSEPSFIELIDKIEKYDGNQKYDINEFANSLPAPLRHVFDELILFDISLTSPDYSVSPDFTRCLYELKRISLKKQIKTIAGQDTDKKHSDEMKQLTSQLTEIEKKLTTI